MFPCGREPVMWQFESPLTEASAADSSAPTKISCSNGPQKTKPPLSILYRPDTTAWRKQIHVGMATVWDLILSNANNTAY